MSPLLWSIGDLHVDGEAESNRGLEFRLRALRAAMQPGDILALLGDVTDDGTARQYTEAMRLLWWLRDDNVLCIAVPGNHDVGPFGLLWSQDALLRWESFAAWAGSRRWLDVGNARIFGISTYKATWWPGDTARGRVGWGQRRRLRKELDAARALGKQCVVVGHHSLLCSDPWLLLEDRREVGDVLRGRAALYIGAHTHIEERGEIRSSATTMIQTIGSFREGARLRPVLV